MNNAIVDLLNLFYPLSSTRAPTEKITALPSLNTNTIIIGNTTDNFELLTDEQVLSAIYYTSFLHCVTFNFK
ncbi:MAG: hypothetical protein ACKPKO_14830 [Candidatus Fonsibacter sp.]